MTKPHHQTWANHYGTTGLPWEGAPSSSRPSDLSPSSHRNTGAVAEQRSICGYLPVEDQLPERDGPIAVELHEFFGMRWTNWDFGAERVGVSLRSQCLCALNPPMPMPPFRRFSPCRSAGRPPAVSLLVDTVTASCSK